MYEMKRFAMFKKIVIYHQRKQRGIIDQEEDSSTEEESHVNSLESNSVPQQCRCISFWWRLFCWTVQQSMLANGGRRI